MKKRRILAIFLALALALTMSSAALAASKSELESSYGFRLTDSDGQFSGAESAEYLAKTEAALSKLTTAFTKGVVDFYKSKGYTPSLYLKTGSWETENGTFSTKNAKITLITFRSGDGVAVSESTVVHEFGHMVNYALDLKLGASKVQSQWEALGMGENDFISSYASTGYREDFAETFMYMVCDRKDFYLQEENSVPIQKLKLMDSLISANLPGYPGLAGFNFYFPQTPSAWSADVVAAMRERKMLLGTPLYQAPITRAEFCELMVRMTENIWGDQYDPETLWPILPADHQAVIDKQYFSDVPRSGLVTMGIEKNYFINKAYELGIIQGAGTAFDGLPIFKGDGPITRDAAAKMLTEACRVMGRDVSAEGAESFADAASFQAWSVPYINYMRKSGIMGGVGGNAFRPAATYSYEQAYLTVSRILSEEK